MPMSQKKILIPISHLGGHSLEYIHHLYMAAKAREDCFFIFSLPDSFKSKSGLLEWPKCNNIKMLFFSETAVPHGKFSRSVFLSKLLSKIAKKNNVSDIFLIYLMEYLPFLPFLIGRQFRISGIIYNIYLYRWKKSSFVIKIQDILKYVLFSKISIFKRIFILNDKASARYLNKLYHSSCFQSLPDPYIPFQGGIIPNLKQKLGIKDEKTILLHFGVLCDEKGSLIILDAIECMDAIELKNYTFIFAGRLRQNIKDLFKKRLSSLCNKCEIVFLEGFQSYEMLASLCSICDVILTPYKRSGQSSGCIGYAAQFKKPVIASPNGLLGKLVRRYKLGLIVDELNGNSLVKAIRRYKDWNYTTDLYLADNQLSKFQKAIIDSVCF